MLNKQLLGITHCSRRMHHVNATFFCFFFLDSIVFLFVFPSEMNECQSTFHVNKDPTNLGIIEFELEATVCHSIEHKNKQFVPFVSVSISVCWLFIALRLMNRELSCKVRRRNREIFDTNLVERSLIHANLCREN